MRIEGLSFSYGRFTIFDNFDFESNAQVTLIRGASGCGKSTLLKLIVRHFQPAKVAVWDVPHEVRLILQEDALFPWLTGIENIRILAPDNVGFERCIAAHPMHALCRSFLGKRAYEMSFGQRRLIELFRAFLYPPQLLCLDEPFNFIDANNREKVARIIRETVVPCCPVIISSHYREDDAFFDGADYEFSGELPVSRLDKKR